MFTAIFQPEQGSRSARRYSGQAEARPPASIWIYFGPLRQVPSRHKCEGHQLPADALALPDASGQILASLLRRKL